MVPTGEMIESRYIVKDSEGRYATAYNLGFGKALALRWAKIACQELKGQVFFHSDKDPKEYKPIFKYTKDAKPFG